MSKYHDQASRSVKKFFFNIAQMKIFLKEETYVGNAEVADNAEQLDQDIVVACLDHHADQCIHVR